jgi:serine/threonine-protein kinase
MSRYIAGEVIAEKYRLVRPLGEGGMGCVWVAQNVALDVQVALKLIRADVASANASERLLKEARAAARLKHPSIVRIFDFGKTRHDDPFIVMELLHGENLREVLERETCLPATYAIQLLLPIAEGLAAAHRQAIVHRDLKPENIYLARSDDRVQPKIVDFGIAILGSEQTESRLTRDGDVVGSPDYMAPEQARGVEDIDVRTDIWAFCVVLYEALTGHVPFADANYNALLQRIIEDPAPSILDFSVGDADLWAILDQGLRKDRTERWQSMRELGEALACWLVERGVTEDVYGHSLRAGWLDSRSSFTEEVGSGNRSILSFRPVTAPGGGSAVRRLTVRAEPKRTRQFLAKGVLGVGVACALGGAAVLGWQATHTSVPLLERAMGAARSTLIDAPPVKAPAAEAVVLPKETTRRQISDSLEAGTNGQAPSSSTTAPSRLPKRSAAHPARATPVPPKAPTPRSTPRKPTKPPGTYEDFGF